MLKYAHVSMMRSYPREFGQKVAWVATQLFLQPSVDAALDVDVSDDESLKNLDKFFKDPIDDFWEDVAGLEPTT